MPESAWKFLFYLGAWSYSAYLLFGTDYPFFHDPPSVFYGRGPARQSRVGEGSGLHGGSGHSSHISCWMSALRQGHPKVAPRQGCLKGSGDRKGSCLGPGAIRAQGDVLNEVTPCVDPGGHSRCLKQHVQRPWGLHELGT